MTMLVLAHHLILTTYGFWLPNDPRGSWSEFVRAWELQRFGPATKTVERRSLARDPHDWKLRLEAKHHLARKPVRFTGPQAVAIGNGFARFVAKSGIRILACSILPTHVHMVVSAHRYSIEKIANLLKGAATTQLKTRNIRPFAQNAYRDQTLPTPWARKQWAVFLSDDAEIERAIRYVVDNPIKEGKPAQRWAFVTHA